MSTTQKPKTATLVAGVFERVPVLAVSTCEGAGTRLRMMHFAYDSELTVYLSSMRGDPKLDQIAMRPCISLLVFDGGCDFSEAEEVEVVGLATVVGDRKERRSALVRLAARSPIVAQLMDSDNSGKLEVVRVRPERIKFRAVRDIIQGLPPDVLEFGTTAPMSDWQTIRSKIGAWKSAVRLPFLTATLVALALGFALAGISSPYLAAIASAAALLLHVGVNLLNDYNDHRSGNDARNEDYVRPFTGGSRVIQLGTVKPPEILVASTICFIIASALGLILAATIGPAILFLGAAGILSGVLYSSRLGSRFGNGLGELLVALNFGPLMATGAYITQASNVGVEPIVASLPIAFLIAAVLTINNIPDWAADSAVGKRTLVVSLGKRRTMYLLDGLIALSYAALIANIAFGFLPLEAISSFIFVPLLLKAVRIGHHEYDNSFLLAPANSLIIASHLGVGTSIVLSVVWSRLSTQTPIYGIAIILCLVLIVLGFYYYNEGQRRVFTEVKQVLR